METEKATYDYDLPHPYRRAGIRATKCRCGQGKEAEIHTEAAREVAKAQDILLGRELGS